VARKVKKEKPAHWLIRELESKGEARLSLVIEGQEHAVYDFPDYISAMEALDDLRIHIRFFSVTKKLLKKKGRK